MSAYEAVLFDCDGVLVEPPSRDTQASAARGAFRDVGIKDVAPEHVDALCSGVTVERVHDIAATYDLDPGRLWAARERLDERSQHSAFEAGDRDCYGDIETITQLSIPVGVVSNNHHTTIEYVIDRFDLAETVETFYGREKGIESLRYKKPRPHYLELALADLSATTAVYIGDKEKDLLAAHRAGIDAAFLRRSHVSDATLSVTPTYEIDSLRDVASIVAE